MFQNLAPPPLHDQTLGTNVMFCLDIYDMLWNTKPIKWLGLVSNLHMLVSIHN